jgi:ferric-dicitrate binding protein FerR (iron transport regulator)
MQGERRDLDCDSAVRWLLRFMDNDVSTLSSEELAEWVRWSSEPGNLEQFDRCKRKWRSLDLVLPEVARPSHADIEADEYDGSVPISHWLAHTR